MTHNNSTTFRLCERCQCDISARHGVARFCVECSKERRRERDRERLANNDQLRESRYARNREYHRNRKANDPEWKAEVNRKGREWQHNKYHNDPEWRRKENDRRVVLTRNRRQSDPAFCAKEAKEQSERMRVLRSNPAFKSEDNRKQREWQRKRYQTDEAYRRRIIAYVCMRKPWDGTVNQASIAELLKAQKGKCACCRSNIRDGYHLDHIFPLSKGGLSTLENCQLLCQPCNSRKHASLVYFPPSGGQGRMALGR